MDKVYVGKVEVCISAPNVDGMFKKAYEELRKAGCDHIDGDILDDGIMQISAKYTSTTCYPSEEESSRRTADYVYRTCVPKLIRSLRKDFLLGEIRVETKSTNKVMIYIKKPKAYYNESSAKKNKKQDILNRIAALEGEVNRLKAELKRKDGEWDIYG